MAKSAGDVSELDKLRGETWVAHCLAVAECKTLAQLHEKVPVLSSVDLWSKYKGGKAKPLESTVRAVNLVLPSTSDSWFYGPVVPEWVSTKDGMQPAPNPKLPVWKVVGSDPAVCLEVVDDYLASFSGPETWQASYVRPLKEMSTTQKVQAVLEWTLGPNFWLVARDDYAEDPARPEWMNPRHRVRRLDELVEGGPNLLAFFYKTSKRKLAESPHSTARWMFKELTPRFNLTMVALAVVCNSSDDITLKEVAFYVTSGVKQGLVDCFGTHIAAYIEDNI